nr:hypothetical protein [Tanacetum cinerariifolium]
ARDVDGQLLLLGGTDLEVHRVLELAGRTVDAEQLLAAEGGVAHDIGQLLAQGIVFTLHGGAIGG